MKDVTQPEAELTTKLEPRVSHLSDAEAIKPFGLNMKVLMRTEDTGGAFSALMCYHEPGEGPPPHVHYSQEEYFFVVDGTYELTVADKTVKAGPGTMVFIPRNAVHTFRNCGDKTAAMLDWSIPGGQDRYFRTIHQMLAAGSFNAANAGELSKQYDTAFIPKPG
jgi:mannose-6-phosphate isomerase-like protein (cupin superfamily)